LPQSNWAIPKHIEFQNLRLHAVSGSLRLCRANCNFWAHQTPHSMPQWHQAIITSSMPVAKTSVQCPTPPLLHLHTQHGYSTPSPPLAHLATKVGGGCLACRCGGEGRQARAWHPCGQARSPCPCCLHPVTPGANQRSLLGAS